VHNVFSLTIQLTKNISYMEYNTFMIILHIQQIVPWLNSLLLVYFLAEIFNYRILKSPYFMSL